MRKMRQAEEELEALAWLKAGGVQLKGTEEGAFTHVLRVKKKQKLFKSKQKAWQEELEALAWLEAGGVLLNDFFNNEVLTKIKAEPEKGAKMLKKL